MRPIVLVLCALVLATTALAADPGPDRRLSFANGGEMVFGGRPPHLEKSVITDTVVLIGPWGSGAQANGQFEDPSGNPAWNGWTSRDLTIPEVNHWQVSDYGALAGNYSAWCGDLGIPACSEFDSLGGYGNSWDDMLEWRAAVTDPGQSCTVNVSALASHDSEPGYDFSYVSTIQGGTTFDLWMMDWQGSDVVINVQTTYLPGQYENGNEVVVQFRFTSDGAWSDEDCNFPTNGAFRVDEVVITLDNGPDYAHDFEDGTLGDFELAYPSGVGDFAKVWTGLQTLPNFPVNTTPQVAFVDDGLVVPGTGGTTCLTWCYGPGGFIVNHRGGLLGPDYHIHNVIESPIVAWPGPDHQGANLDFDVWRHETLAASSPGIFFVWSVRSTADPDSNALAEAPWVDRNFVYYGGPDWLRQANIIGDLIVPDAKWAQVRLGVYELGWVWGWYGADGTPAPYFDNVRFTGYPYYGPALSATVVDLPHDNFPAHGQVDLVNLGTNSIRFDMGRPSDRWKDLVDAPGDSIVIKAVPQRLGATIVGTPRMHWRLQRNPLFDPYRTAGLPDVGSVDMWQVQGTGGPVADTYAVDLPDSGFLFPGDFLYYYFEATDAIAGAEPQTVTLPADTTGYSDFSDPMAYPPIYKLHALPTVWENQAAPGTYGQPTVLFWDDAGAVGNRDEWYDAFRQIGYTAGVDYDIYYTNNPSDTAHHGLGGRATVDQIAGYDDLVYTSGVQTGNTLAGNPQQQGFDSSNDVGLLSAWFALGGKDMFLTGDDLAGDLTRNQPETLLFLQEWMGVDLVDENVLGLIGPNTAPLVNTEFLALPIFPNVSEWQAVGSDLTVTSGYYGGGTTSTGNKRYDAVIPRLGAVRLAEFLDTAGNPGAFAYSAVSLNVRNDVNARIISLPYDFQSIWTPTGNPAKIAAPLSARVKVLRDVMNYFGGPLGGPPSDVPEADAFRASHFPNPFNPAVTISYALPRDDRLRVRVYDVRGQLVRDLVDARRPAGPGKVRWDGRDDEGRTAAAGIYFYEVRTGDDALVGKMALIK